jgi:uncharacterized membrane protein YozB (DUF420 family)
VIEWLPHINVSLNALAIVLLLTGYVFISQGRELAHKRTMMATLGVSVLFLICYLIYHANVPSKEFPKDPTVAPTAVRYMYYGLLLSHVLLAATVPVLAVWTIVLGVQNKRDQHKRLAKWTWPIWLYVSVTGVIVYLMLYQIFVIPDASA